MTTDTLLNGSAPAPAADDPNNAAPAAADTPKPDAPVADKPQSDKPDGEKPEGKGEGEDKGKKDEPQGAPEKYEFSAPEGVTLDKDILGEFETYARELNLPQDKAQAAVDLGVKMLGKWTQAMTDHAVQTRSNWAEEARTDKELGGEKFEENLGLANRALEAVGSPELIELLNQTGLCNNVHVIRAFYNVGKKVSSDQFVSGAKGESKGDLAERMYAKSMPKK